MKTLFKIGVLTIICMLLFQPVNGQKLLKKITDKAKQKVEQRIEKKVDEKIDKELDKVEESLEKNDEQKESDNTSSETPSRDEKMQNRMQGILKGIGISGEPVPFADSYTFDQKIQMHIESFDDNDNKTSEGEFITHLNPNSKSMAYQVVSGDMAKQGQGMFII